MEEDAGSALVNGFHLGFCPGIAGRAPITLHTRVGRGKTSRSGESSSSFHYRMAAFL